MDYEKMLQSAIDKMPKNIEHHDRFEIPKVSGRIQGTNTVITNFGAICEKFSRDMQLVTKYLLRELAVNGQTRDQELHLFRKLNPALINERIEKFAKTYVICSSCTRPDTTLIFEEGKTFVRCSACGSKNLVKNLN